MFNYRVDQLDCSTFAITGGNDDDWCTDGILAVATSYDGGGASYILGYGCGAGEAVTL